MKNILLFALALFLQSSFAHAQIITTIAGSDSISLGDGGPATACELYNPSDVAIDTAGNIYIADGSNNRIRKVNTSGIITTIAGTGTAGYNGDGIAATLAELSYPSSIALDGSGNIYICDDHNFRIRMINTSGIITTIAGTGTSGYNGDNIAATSAQITSSAGIAVDGSGNVYISDIGNNRIRKISPVTGGIITTISGTGIAGYSGNGGPATAGEIYHPIAITTDGLGNVYFTEYGNNCVRKINAVGILSTIAGNGTGGYSGDSFAATMAQLDFPTGVKVDNLGNVYISDANNNRIREVNTSDIITTIAGTGIAGFSGDGGPAILAEFISPGGIAVNGQGNVYIADWGNNRIRYIRNTVSIKSIINDSVSFKVYPNPAPNGQFTISISSNTNEKVNIIITDLLGEKIKNFIATTNKPMVVQLDVPTGIYILSAYDGYSISSTKIIVK